MASTIIFATPGTIVPVEGLCATCWLPALVEIPVLGLSHSGVSQLGTVLACRQCRTKTSRVP